jgi:hypothetical protein
MTLSRAFSALALWIWEACQFPTSSRDDAVMMSWPTYVFNEGTLVLEGVTLGEEVELVVEMLVDLASSTVLYK